MSLSSVNEIKLILMISGSAYDDTISTLLPIVESHIKEACNYNFVSSSIAGGAVHSDHYIDQPVDAYVIYSDQTVYPDGLKLVAAEMIEYLIYKQKKANITSEQIGNYSVTYGNLYPEDILESLKPYRHVKFG